jgi:hypothetical protein
MKCSPSTASPGPPGNAADKASASTKMLRALIKEAAK